MSIDIAAPAVTERPSGSGQPYPYQRVELVEPDWTRFPGWRDVTAEDWASVQWQRAHCVKNVKQLRELLGDLVDERFYADLERDQAERATMSMLVPPQMMNTMVPIAVPAGAGSLTEALYADPIRNYMIPVFSDRRTDWSSHPHATRDSLHEHDMWATEGLTHRYPTKVLAELLPTCPQYCGHCTRMDLVGNSTPVIEKLKFAGKPNDRIGDMIDYLRRTPSVRDVVVSGGDVANMPWPRLEAFLTSVLEVDNIRDIRLATKALIGLPQHWLQPEVVDGVGRVAAIARERGVSLAIHTHANHANSMTPIVAKATRAMLDAGVRDVRNQGVLLNGVNADGDTLLDLCFRLLDGAQIMPYYFYMCDMIPFSEHWRVSVADAQRLQHHIMGYLPGFATPRIVCDVPFVGKRWVHQLADYDTERGISYWTKNYKTSIEADLRRRALADLRVLRPDPHPPRRRPGVVGRARSSRRDRPQGRRDGRGLAAYRCPPGLVAVAVRSVPREFYRRESPADAGTPTRVRRCNTLRCSDRQSRPDQLSTGVQRAGFGLACICGHMWCMEPFAIRLTRHRARRDLVRRGWTDRDIARSRGGQVTLSRVRLRRLRPLRHCWQRPRCRRPTASGRGRCCALRTDAAVLTQPGRTGASRRSRSGA